MIKFKYRYCKALMARYLSGDLPEAARRRMAHYIDECEDCYREYMRHREFAHKLERDLPILGKANAEKLDLLWSALQSELNAPAKRRGWLGKLGSRSTAQFSYGLVMVAISLALLLPMVIGYHSSLSPVDLPSMPQVAPLARTPSTDLADQQFVTVATRSRPSKGQEPRAQKTPSPRY